MKYLYRVNVIPGIAYDCLADESQHVNEGDDVIFQCEKYQDCGRVIKKSSEPYDPASYAFDRNGGPIPIIRVMNLVDKGKAHENEARAKSMFRTAHRKIGEHHLEMKLLNSHYAFDKSLAIFQFAAESRVDFRELVRDLSGALHCRVELRQIGVRDEASIQGGLGPCGRPFCCATFLTKFQTVNVKMAKMQRLSLNPASVSGGCGRLKCCLRYEAEGYQEMFRTIPRNGSLCETPRGRGRVLDGNALTQIVRVRLEDENGLIVDFNADEVSRLSGGRNRHLTKEMAAESSE